MMTNIDLEQKCSDLNIPLIGVFNKDALPQRKRFGCYIFNLSDSVDTQGRDLPGTHWTACIVAQNEQAYFDAFGFEPPAEVDLWLNQDYLYNPKQIQNQRSGTCGWYCLHWLYFMTFQHKKHDKLTTRYVKYLKLWSSDVTKNQARLAKFLEPL